MNWLMIALNLQVALRFSSGWGFQGSGSLFGVESG